MRRVRFGHSVRTSRFAPVLLVAVAVTVLFPTNPALAVTSWVIQPTPNPSGALTSELDGISCASTDSCIAVGDYAFSQDTDPLVEYWNGSTWTIESAPNQENGVDTDLSGVSC